MLRSMTRVGNCYDNAFMDSFLRTLSTVIEVTRYAESLEALHELSRHLRYYKQDHCHFTRGCLTTG